MLSGMFGEPLENLKVLLADVSAFRTFTSTSTGDAAKERIFSVYQPEKDKKWPLALVTFKDGDWSADRDSVGGGIGSFEISSDLTLIFEKKGAITAENVEAFVNEIGEITKGILTLSGSVNYFNVESIHFEGFCADDKQKPNLLAAPFKIKWS